MNGFGAFDTYALRARLFPAIIAAAPAFAALALLISWRSFGLSQVVSSIGLLVLTYAIADAARARGRAIEGALHNERGGLPSVTLFRRSDLTISSGSKDRYRVFLGHVLGIDVPTPGQEQEYPAIADDFYAQCGVWLRQHTRDSRRFRLLFGENVTYGFRRNLLGVKRIALFLNALVVLCCIALLWRIGWMLDTSQGSRILMVLLVATAHAAYMLLAVNRDVVWDASRAYGRELILSCEAFLPHPEEAIKAPVPARVRRRGGRADG